MSTACATAVDTVGVILAGGRASRMGQDKAFVKLAGEPLIARILGLLRTQVDSIVINTNSAPAAFEAYGVPLVTDRLAGFMGPLAGLHAAMCAAETHGARRILSVAVDTPFFPDDLLARLDAGTGPNRDGIAIAASAGRLHPVFGLYPVSLAETLETFLHTGGRRLHDWLAPLDPATIEFPILVRGGRQLDPFFNINTPDDLARADIWSSTQT